jgi:hypothetical protein
MNELDAARRVAPCVLEMNVTHQLPHRLVAGRIRIVSRAEGIGRVPVDPQRRVVDGPDDIGRARAGVGPKPVLGFDDQRQAGLAGAFRRPGQAIQHSVRRRARRGAAAVEAEDNHKLGAQLVGVVQARRQQLVKVIAGLGRRFVPGPVKVEVHPAHAGARRRLGRIGYLEQARRHGDDARSVIG